VKSRIQRNGAKAQRIQKSVTPEISSKVAIIAPRDEHVSEMIQSLPSLWNKSITQISVLRTCCLVFAWFSNNAHQAER